MNTHERIAGYADRSGSAKLLVLSDDSKVAQGLTPAQRRRIKHKSGSRKAHPHIEGERCYTCRPAKRPSVAMRPARLRPNVRA